MGGEVARPIPIWRLLLTRCHFSPKIPASIRGGPSVCLVRWISAVALVIAQAMDYYTVEVVTFGARCAEVQVIGHSSTPKIP